MSSDVERSAPCVGLTAATLSAQTGAIVATAAAARVQHPVTATPLQLYVQPAELGSLHRCCICGSEQGVGADAYAPLDGAGRRVDAAQRPELAVGSVEYIAPADYTVRPPMPPCYFFVIDVSQAAVASGGLAAACAAIRSTLSELAQRSPLTRVGFLTFDSTVHFYSLGAAGGAAQMMVVPDVDDPFPPLPDEHYVPLDGALGAADALLAALPAAFAATQELDTALASALQVRYVLLLPRALVLLVAQHPCRRFQLQR